MSEQHYRMTLEDAIAHYRVGDLTAKGALKLWTRIRLAEGWECHINPKEIRQALSKNGKPMPRSTFWHAMHELAEEGEIEFDEPDNITIRRLSKKSDIVQNPEPPSKILDHRLKNETTIQNPELPSQILDEQESEPLSVKGCSHSTNSFQLFINSLSDSERESFLKFSEEKAKAMPNPPQLVDAWIAKHYLDLHKQFVKSAAGQEAKKEAIAAQFDWRNDPRFTQWLWEAFNRGYEWVHEDEAEREQRNAFYDWALKVNAYLGICYEE